MNPRGLQLILALYPPSWRLRHGEELTQLLTDLAPDESRGSRLRLLGDLLLGATTQRIASLTPAFGLIIAVAIAASAGAAYAVSTILREQSVARVIVQRNHAGRITAIKGAPANVVFNPNTHKVVSIHRRGRH